MSSLFRILLALCFLAVNGQDSVPMQGQQVCNWQLVSEKESLAGGGREGVSVARNWNTIETSYRHGGNMGCSDPTFHTMHTWTTPPGVLSPGETLSFDVSAAWSLEGSPACTSLTAGVNTSIVAGITRILAEQKKIIVSKEPDGSVSKSGIWVVPAGQNVGETLTITAHGDGGGVGGSVFYNYQWVCEAPAASETPEQQATPTVTPTPAACASLSAEAKLNLILGRYSTQIPKGLTDSGNKNNLLSVWYKEYEEYVCGSYQAKVLQLLTEIKYDPDPCISAWLDDWDYGPIESLWGGHQAVVIYPTGTTWTETGLVLDPWITQTPEMYTIQDWSLQFSAGSQHGIRGSSDYEKQAQYPTVGGAYAPPGELKLTATENDFIRTLPADKQDWLKKMAPVTRKAWVVQTMRKLKQNVTVSVNSPLEVYMTDDAGHSFGVKEGVWVDELPDISFRRFLQVDGHYWTEVEYPSNSNYRLVMYGTDAGQARVFVSLFDPENTGPVYQYDFAVGAGNFYQTRTAEIGAALASTGTNAAEIAPTIATTADQAWIEAQPALGEGEQANNKAPFPLPVWLIVSLAGLCGLLVTGSLTAVLVFWLRKPRNSPSAHLPQSAPAPNQPPASLQPWQLTALSGPDAGKRFLPGMFARLGSAPQNEIQLNDPWVAPFHSQIQQTSQGCIVTDLGSPGGTFVNEMHIQRSAWLNPGDRLRIGNTTLQMDIVPGQGIHRTRLG